MFAGNQLGLLGLGTNSQNKFSAESGNRTELGIFAQIMTELTQIYFIVKDSIPSGRPK